MNRCVLCFSHVLFFTRHTLTKTSHLVKLNQSLHTFSSLKVRLNWSSQTIQKSTFLPRRTLYIQTYPTPNINALKFLPGRPVLSSTQTLNFTSYREAQRSPLAAALFGIDGVTGVLLGSDFIAVNIANANEWSFIKPSVFGAITDFYASGQPVLLPLNENESEQISDTTILETDSEVVAMIKELIETRIRPSVQEDGGDISYKGFDEKTGIVWIQMQGSCVGCASSAVTLKNGIENMLMHYIPEVKEVREYKDEVLEAVSRDQLKKLEEQLEKTTSKEVKTNP